MSDEADEESIENVLDTIGDRGARTVLASLSRSPKSAKELAEAEEMSLPTVYRRLDDLMEHDLVNSRTAPAADGNHYKVFECNFDSTVISLSDDAYDVRIYRQDAAPDRFADLWDELSGEK